MSAKAHARPGVAEDTQVSVSFTEKDDGSLILEVENFVGAVTILAPGGVHLDLLPMRPRPMTLGGQPAVLPCLGRIGKRSCTGVYPNGRVVARCDACIERSRQAEWEAQFPACERCDGPFQGKGIFVAPDGRKVCAGCKETLAQGCAVR